MLELELAAVALAGIAVGRFWASWVHQRLERRLRAEIAAYAEARARITRLESALIRVLSRETERAERQLDTDPST